MIYSMTGFGRGKIEEEGREITVEVKTLNHRFLDVYVRLPRNLSFLEEHIRSTVRKHLTRGRVEVNLSCSNHIDAAVDVNINKPLLNAYLSCFDKLEQEHNIMNDIALSSLVNIPDIFIINEKDEDQENLKNMVINLVEEVLADVKDMRRIEGGRLKEDLLQRIELIKSMLSSIEKRAPYVVDEYREKLKNRLNEILHGTDLDENRFNMEVAFFAERCNITEEIVRFHSHIGQFINILDASEPAGRKLDFLVQEMNREINTIGSKANDLTISGLVVEIKSELEKIREQVQNIE
ncbi:MAG: YicC family protein [Clostridiales bacterium]|nr:YicC family protein [Clostridiales bacterium]